jgi:hypothetical protein
MKYARIVNNIVINTTSINPADVFHPAVVAEFESVPKHVDIGWHHIEGVWHAPHVEELIDIDIAETPLNVKITPSEFMLLFTSKERLTLKSLRTGDPVLNDFFELLEDSRLISVDLSRVSTISALTYCHSLLVTGNIIATENSDQRLAQILSGTIL